MPSSSFRCFLLSIFSLALLLGASRTASACTCGQRPTVLDAFEKADEVIIARVVSVDKIRDSDKSPDENQRRYVGDVRSTTLIVEKIFKGTLKVRDEIVFGQGNGANCIWTFTEESIGDQFLFYLKRPEKELWYASECGRSRGLEGASDDLLYLENMNKLRGKTRISSRLGGWKNPNLDIEGKVIKIIGPTKTYETKTNKDGVFEIYDLPPGKYAIQPEIDEGWKIDAYYLRYSPSATTIYVNPGDVIENIDIIVPKLEETITVEGILRFSDDRPAYGTQVLFTATGTNNNVDGDVRVQTDNAGRFTMKVLKGLTGELAGQELLIRGVYGDCNANFDELLAKTTKNNIYVRSNVIKLTTDQNQYNIELTLPFKRCDGKVIDTNRTRNSR